MNWSCFYMWCICLCIVKVQNWHTCTLLEYSCYAIFYLWYFRNLGPDIWSLVLGMRWFTTILRPQGGSSEVTTKEDAAVHYDRWTTVPFMLYSKWLQNRYLLMLEKTDSSTDNQTVSFIIEPLVNPPPTYAQTHHTYFGVVNRKRSFT